MKGNKTPRVDEIYVIFFQSQWETIRKSLCKYV